MSDIKLQILADIRKKIKDNNGKPAPVYLKSQDEITQKLREQNAKYLEDLRKKYLNDDCSNILEGDVDMRSISSHILTDIRKKI